MPHRTASIEQIRAFHGHVGPYVVTGLRAGEVALRCLGARKYFGLEVVVHCPERPSPSCFIDGVQLGSGCTMGKSNISHVIAEEVYAEFRNTDTGQGLRIAVNRSVIAAAVARMREEGDDAGAEVIFDAPEGELFELCLCEGRTGGAER
jgi:formylmethanofuran dehydrogenase subunit E